MLRTLNTDKQTWLTKVPYKGNQKKMKRKIILIAQTQHILCKSKQRIRNNSIPHPGFLETSLVHARKLHVTYLFQDTPLANVGYKNTILSTLKMYKTQILLILQNVNDRLCQVCYLKLVHVTSKYCRMFVVSKVVL